jgi:hypothetical protein
MTKNILIVGTSHTAGACVDPNENMMPKNADGFSTLEGKEYFKAKRTHVMRNWLKPSQRWWQGLNAKYNVTTFCVPGVSPQQQFYSLSKWLKQNPDLKFDGAILEGRLPVTQSIAVPSKEGNYKFADTIDEFRHWLHEYPIIEPDDMNHFMHYIGSRSRKEAIESYSGWYNDWIISDLPVVEIVSTNMAICKVLETVAPEVTFISFSTYHATEQDQRYIMYPLKKKYALDESWPGYCRILGDTIPPGVECKCGHFNEEGNRRVSEVLTPAIEKRLKLCES